MAHGVVAALLLTQLVLTSSMILVSTVVSLPSVTHDCIDPVGFDSQHDIGEYCGLITMCFSWEFSACAVDFCLWISVRVLQGREISGPLQRRQAVPTCLYSKQQLFSRTLGHLSAVYCLLFDRSGHYVITVSVHTTAVFKSVWVVTLRGAGTGFSSQV